MRQLHADKFDLADIDRKLFSVFSEQIFNTGFVHADPHPGNGINLHFKSIFHHSKIFPVSSLVFVRKNAKTGRAELVLLDHGLYEFLPEPTRLSLCQFWEAIVLKDINKMQKYAKELNVEGKESCARHAGVIFAHDIASCVPDYDKLAEILLQRPLEMSGPMKTRLTEQEIAFMQEMAKKRFDTVLLTLKLMPRSMLFVVR